MLPPYLTSQDLDQLIERAFQEDVGKGDVTTRATIHPEIEAEGTFLAKEDGVLAGLEAASRVFAYADDGLDISWMGRDGGPSKAGEPFGFIRGKAHSLLTTERLALNIIQRMSGIATATRRMIEAAHPHEVEILDTRKTAPGLRGLDKWAVKLGGGQNHRIGLYDMILVKDNHIAAAGSLAEAIGAARRFRDLHNPSLRIEVEARTLDEVATILEVGGIDIVLLDNMVERTLDGSVDTSRLQEAVNLVDGRIRTEASGNVTLETVQAIAATGVSAISSGALTHSVQALDVSLKVKLNPVHEVMPGR